jgi:nucleoside-diphosphate-sugar epimerase
MSSLLVLGAGYLGAAIADRALDAGDFVTLADNWFATERAQVAPLEDRGARVVDCDLRDVSAVDGLLADQQFDRVLLLAAQASRPLSFEEPDYTEETNVLGVRRVAERARCPVVFASSLHVYGGGLSGVVDAQRPYGDQGDLAHASKVSGELALKLYARRNGFALALLRLGP